MRSRRAIQFLKNYRVGERCDIHAFRAGPKGWAGASRHTAVVNDSLLITIGRSRSKPPRGHISASLPSEARLYPNCMSCPRQCMWHTEWAFSSGSIILSHFESDKNVSKILVFGMNFNRFYSNNKGHDFAQEKRMARICCTKCKLHPTPNPSYFPYPTPQERWGAIGGVFSPIMR